MTAFFAMTFALAKRTPFAAQFLAAQFLAILAGLMLLSSVPASAQTLSGALSHRHISVDSSFAGLTVTLFGNVEPNTEAGQTAVTGPFDVVVVITGPKSARVAREKTHQAGVWLNTEQVTFSDFPSYKWVFANRPLDDIANPKALNALHISLGSFPDVVKGTGNGDAQSFKTELVRLMEQKRLFGVDPKGITFESPTLYSAKIDLPGDVTNGTFVAETFLFKDKQLLARKAELFSVRKTGFERFVGDAAHTWPLIYGLATVLLGMVTGWLGGVLFRR